MFDNQEDKGEKKANDDDLCKLKTQLYMIFSNCMPSIYHHKISKLKKDSKISDPKLTKIHNLKFQITCYCHCNLLNSL